MGFCKKVWKKASAFTMIYEALNEVVNIQVEMQQSEKNLFRVCNKSAYNDLRLRI